ncbi:MAG TPA: MinD/ParA family protein [Desulfobacterales bacterium]|nr:MAG: flagellar synthesis regulator FleN [Deltaproteobacteria bacterium]HHC24959.1 MinD/ParA family protein [Desulfobacterales bacterium]
MGRRKRENSLRRICAYSGIEWGSVMPQSTGKTDISMKKDPSTNIISFQERLLKKTSVRMMPTNDPKTALPKIIAVSSGKGGVGKTNIVANLGYVLSGFGKKILIMDTDLGLGNLDVLLGITPKYNISHVISGEKAIVDIMVDGPGKMKILPASSGIQALTHLTRSQMDLISDQMLRIVASFDAVLIDTAAGISSNVLYFNASAQDVCVVVTPDLTAITDAYALMKVLSIQYGISGFRLLVNQVENAGEAREIFNHLELITRQFLDISIHFMGHILKDDNIPKGVRCQKMVSDMYPKSPASVCFKVVAQQIYDMMQN